MSDRPTLMVVHAHPDDEAISTGGVLSRYAAQGVRTVLVTCTDGGCGDAPGGLKPGDPGHDPTAVVTQRLVELEASCAVLDVTHLELLGYADSGMAGWPQNEAPGAFWATPVEEAADKLAHLMERYQPDVVVTYDANGFYGHPDHIQAHRITMAALAIVGSSAKVYWTTAPHSALARMSDVIRGQVGGELAADPGQADEEAADVFSGIGLPDDEVSTWVDVSAFTDQKFDSLAAHASQGENIFFLGMGREGFAEFMGVETFVRVDADATPGAREDDLFAGVRF